MDIDGLLGRMSLAEKIGQLNHPNIGGADTTGAGAASANIETRIRDGEVGSLAAGAPLPRLAELQKIAVEQSPHGVPLLFSLDVVHGHRTVFPLPVALACAFDTDLVTRTARAAAIEAAASGVMLAWAPMLDVSRDARWGRCAESPGEDPFVGSAFARAMVAGYQQDDLTRADTMMACAKHFAGYGFAEAGRDYNVADISAYRIHNVVLPPFRAALEAGVGAVMVGFHDLAGIPCTAHRELLHDLLRERWSFDGLIVSDYTAIMELMHHGVAADEKEAAYLAFHAGVDIDLVDEYYSRHLAALITEGRIAEAEIDAACRRVLRAKDKLGLFENPYRGLDEAKRDAVTLTPQTRALAREAAAKSCVLLKNDGVLPLARNRMIALVGPLADSRADMQGTWAVSAKPEDSVTVLEGIRAAFDNVLYAKGANVVDDPNVAARLNVFGEIVHIDPPELLLADAVAQARKADVIVACLGEAKEHTGESSTRSTLELPGSQRQFVEVLAATGKPLVLVTMSGRPLALEWEDRHANAILHAWFPGTEAGHAIADLLTGAANPSGKLAMSFPRDSGQCPMTYAEPPTGRPADKIGVDPAGDAERDTRGRRVFRKFTTACRIEGASTPLYAFGHGLSYSTFAYGDVAVDHTELHGDDAVLTASVTVRNSGKVAGEETVQLYVGDPVASRSRPVRELKGFRKIALAPGESKTVSFRITTADLGFIRAERIGAPEPVFEPGEFVVEIGASSDRLGTKRVVWRSKER
ncbi:MAG TPA: beta-glucosidase BglX [Pseudolabrys sp.]